MRIWLDANLDAHPFVSAAFWHENFEYAKAQIPKAETYVDEKNGIVAGFIGLNGNYIEGLFVKKEFRSSGIGIALLDQNAVAFYIKNGFSVKEKLGSAPADEYAMLWEKEDGSENRAGLCKRVL